MSKDYMSQAFAVAAFSTAKKRKVGAVITFETANDEVLTVEGCNYNPASSVCEDSSGNTLPEVIHAEVNAINNLEEALKRVSINAAVLPRLYVTHQPCENCLDKFFQAVHRYWGLNKHLDMRELVIIANTGMKFDTDKLRFDLIPAIATESLAAVLTYGAKKYKPNNWRSVDPQRYVAAFERHWHSYVSGERLDKESGLPHLAHCMTNLSFLLELGFKPEQQQTLADYCKNL